MAQDVDIVRCASPWPGVAAQVVEAMAKLGAGPWSTDQLCASTLSGLESGDAEQVLAGLAFAGVCERAEVDDCWATALAASELRRLTEVLRGAECYRRLRLDAQTVEVAVTMPMPPSHLEPRLGSAPGRPGGYLPTQEAFLRVARAARSQLVVVSPFFDSRGFSWLKQVMCAASPVTSKIVVLREADRYAAELGVHHAQWLRETRVAVFDYHLSHAPGSGRPLPFETFHAKLLLADEKLAYVGSANVLGSGDGTSLETGVLIDGPAATQIARLVGGILSVARRL